MIMSDNFTVVDDSDDEFQELLDSLPGLSPIVPGKRGGGRKATNNTGADVLGVKALDEFRQNHVVDLTKKDNVFVNFLYGIVDQNSYSRAVQISRNIKPSYPQVGVLAMSIAKSSEGDIFLQLWKGTIVDGVLSFQKVYSKSKDYKFGKNKSGLNSFWRTDKNNEMYTFGELGVIVPFEEYLNAVVTTTEVPVSFPDEEVIKL